jgi:hypothetical protein
MEWFYTETLIIMIVLVICDDDCKSCFVFVFCKSKKDVPYNDQMKQDKQWSTKHYTENSDWATQTHKEPEVNTCALVGSAISVPLVTPIVILLNDSNTKNINEPLQNMGLMANHNCLTRKLVIFAACYLTHINRYDF